MSNETHTMKLHVDAQGAKAGSEAFAAAVQRIGTATENMDRVTAKAFANLKQRLGGMDFSKIARDVATIGSIRVDSSTVNNISRLSSALAGLQRVVPSAQVSNQLDAFAKSLSRFSTVGGGNIGNVATQISNLANAVRGFRAPSALQTQNLTAFVTALNGLKVTADVDKITSALGRVAIAARDARAALAGLNNVNINLPRGLRGGGYGGGAPNNNNNGWVPPPQRVRHQNNGYGPRSALNPGPYDGLFSGHTRATGHIRGFENLVNPAYQASTILHAAVPAATAGMATHGLFHAGSEYTAFMHSLEVVTHVSDDAGENLRALSDAMKFATDIAKDYGLNIGTIRDQWARFAVTAKAGGFTMDEAKEMFRNFSEAGRARGLSDQEIQRLFNAVDQVMSTGHFSMMQLHKEIGLFMPATNILAKALGKTPKEIEELSSKGMLLSGGLMPFSRQMRDDYKWGLKTAVDSPQSSQSRMASNWTLLTDTVNNNGAWEGMGIMFDKIANVLSRDDVMGRAVAFGQGLKGAFEAAGKAVEWAADHIEALTTAFKVLLALGAAEAALRIAGAFSSLGNMVKSVTVFMWGLVAAQQAQQASAMTSAGASAASAVGGGFWNTVRNSDNVVRATAGANAAVSAAGLASRVATPGVGAAGAIVANGWTAAEANAAAAAATNAANSVGLWTLALEGLGSALAVFNPVTAVLATIAAGIAAVTGVLYLGRNAVLEYGGESITTASNIYRVWKDNVFDYFKEVTAPVRAYFHDMWDGIIKATDAATGYMGRKIDEWTIAIIGAVASVVAQAKNAADWLTGGPGGHTRDTVLGGWKQQSDIKKAEDWAEGLATRQEMDRNNEIIARGFARDQREEKRFVGADRYPAGTPNPTTPAAIGDGKKKGGGAANKAENQFEALMRELNPEIGIIEKYADAMETIANARKQGKQSESGKMFDISAADDYARAIEGVKLKTLESVGAASQQERAMRDVERMQRQLNAVVKLGLLTQDEANQRMEAHKETLRATLNPYDEHIRKIGDEITFLGMRNKERERAIQLRQIEEDIKTKTGRSMTPDEKSEAEKMLLVLQQQKEYSANMQYGVQGWIDSFRDFATEIAKVEQKFMDTMTEAWTEWVMTGEISIKQIANSLERDLVRAASKAVMTDVLMGLGLSEGRDKNGTSGILSSVFSAGGAGLLGKITTGLFGTNDRPIDMAGGEFGPERPQTSGLLGGLGGLLSQAATWIAGQFSEGGYAGMAVKHGLVPASAFAGVPHYAQGTPNTSGGMPAILHPNEAVIPLSRGRKIPVQLSQNDQNGGQAPVNVTMHVTATDADSFARSRGQIEAGVAASLSRAARRNG